MRFKNKVVLITGGASGIGRATALRFAKEGARVVVFDINENKRDKILEEIKEQGAEGMVKICDVADKKAVNKNIDQVINKFNTIDILFNNAGIACHKQIEDITEEDFNRVMEVNFKSMFFISQRVVEIMKNQKSGKIINNASVNAYLPTIKTTIYAATKGAVVSFTKSLAGECTESGITVNAIAPGGIETSANKKNFKELCPKAPAKGRKLVEMDHPVRRLGSPEEIAGLVTFLASEDANFMTATVVHIDGGVTGLWDTVSHKVRERVKDLKGISKFLE